MNAEKYQMYITETMQDSLNTLTAKAKEYADTDDMLHNFKVAACLQGKTQEQALGGMMSKHLVSIYDMIDNAPAYSKAAWQEKIGDTINYLLILSAMIKDAQKYKINL